MKKGVVAFGRSLMFTVTHEFSTSLDPDLIQRLEFKFDGMARLYYNSDPIRRRIGADL